MTDDARIPRTLEELAELEARVHVPFEKLTYGQAEPPADAVLDDERRRSQFVLHYAGF
ncbi:MAG: hypothetical protein U0Q15_19250 [Kineosporiaceae bacterium]